MPARGPEQSFRVVGPNTFTMNPPARVKCSPTVNRDLHVARLKAQDLLPSGGTALPPRPGHRPGQAGEYVVEQLLNRRKTVRGRRYYP